jgi:hypothetical protein
LFDKCANDKRSSPLRHAKSLLGKELDSWLPNAVDEIFFRMPSVTLQYLFVKRCADADAAQQSLGTSDFNDDWLEAALAELGYRSTIASRRMLLDGLEMHGLCSTSEYDRAKKVIAAPLVYRFIRETVAPLGNWLQKLGKETQRERLAWKLDKL